MRAGRIFAAICLVLGLSMILAGQLISARADSTSRGSLTGAPTEPAVPADPPASTVNGAFPDQPRPVLAIETAPPTPPRSGTGDRIIPIYAIPADKPIEGAITPITAHANDIKDALDWFGAQLDGRHPDVIFHDPPSLQMYPVHLMTTEADIANSAEPEMALIMAVEMATPEELRIHVPFIVYEGAFGDPNECGKTMAWDWAAVLIPVGNCNRQPEPEAGFPYGAAFLFAHELTHLLGAAPECAPNNDGTSHVTDDPADIIYTGIEERPWDHLVLDAGNDDYFGHGRADCADISTSRYLTGDEARS